MKRTLPPISYLGPITESEQATLTKLRGSELYKICLKLIAAEKTLVSELIDGCATTEELLRMQGRSITAKRLYNTLNYLANVTIPADEEPEELDQLLPRAKKLRNVVGD